MSKRKSRQHRPLSVKAPAIRTSSPEFHTAFLDGALLEIKGGAEKSYHVRFIDSRDGELVHEQDLQRDQWVRTVWKFFVPWRIEVRSRRSKDIVFSHDFDCHGRRVYIALESNALGDTLAWLPAVEAFRLTQHCQVICSTFLNHLFRDQYPDIEFVEPGTTVHDLYAMYRLGLFYTEAKDIDLNKNVVEFRSQPLAEPAYDILGLQYQVIRPKLPATPERRPLENRYVCVGIHASCQAKYWNNPTGWPDVVTDLQQRGLTVVLLSKEGLEHMGNHVPAGLVTLPEGPLETVIHYLRHAELFIGVGSGLSWLAWAVGCKTCLISGFSFPHTEMHDCIRIYPEGMVCGGCFNRYRLDPDDWNWCPDHKDSPRQFECSKAIASSTVIAAIAPYIERSQSVTNPIPPN